MQVALHGEEGAVGVGGLLCRSRPDKGAPGRRDRSSKMRTLRFRRAGGVVPGAEVYSRMAIGVRLFLRAASCKRPSSLIRVTNWLIL